MELKDIKVGMKYSELKELLKNSNSIFLHALPSFLGTDYKEITNMETKEKIYILWDYDKDIIIDVTDDFNKAVNVERADRNMKEILFNNGY